MQAREEPDLKIDTRHSTWICFQDHTKHNFNFALWSGLLEEHNENFQDNQNQGCKRSALSHLCIVANRF